MRIDGCNNNGWVSDFVAGFNYVIGNHTKPAVINFSWGLPNWLDNVSPGSVNDAAKNAKNAGIFVVVAAGNDNADACSQSPANAREVVTVASVDQSGYKSSFSNHGTCVDIFAPGGSVAVASLGSGHHAGSGTSFAAPYVAGVGALVLQRFPQDSPDLVWSIIQDGASPYVVYGVDIWTPNLLLNSNVPTYMYVQIVGPTTISTVDFACVWEAQVRGGHPPYTYNWTGSLTGNQRVIYGQVYQSGFLNLEVTDAIGNHVLTGTGLNVVSDFNFYCGY